MPTNEERKAVAARLRHIAEYGAPEWATTACCIAECLGEGDYPLWSGSEKLFSRLADIIEPESEWVCRIIEEEPMVFICSECGGEVEDWYLACPYCGCKVVE